MTTRSIGRPCIPGDWDKHAACRTMPYEVMFPERGDDCSLARKVCASCTVRAECLQYALDNRLMHGFYGGKSAKERDRMLGKRTRSGGAERARRAA